LENGSKKIDTVIIITPTTTTAIFVLYTNFSCYNFFLSLFLKTGFFFYQCLPLGGKCWQCDSENFESRFSLKNQKRTTYPQHSLLHLRLGVFCAVLRQESSILEPVLNLYRTF